MRVSRKDAKKNAKDAKNNNALVWISLCNHCVLCALWLTIRIKTTELRDLRHYNQPVNQSAAQFFRGGALRALRVQRPPAQVEKCDRRALRMCLPGSVYLVSR
jgi:hypothetical protein